MLTHSQLNPKTDEVYEGRFAPPMLLVSLMILSVGCDDPISTAEPLLALDQGSIGVLEDIGPDDRSRRDLDLPPIGGREVSDMEVLAPDMEVLAPDMEVLAPDMEVLAPDMEVFAPDMEVFAPDMEVLAPDMEVFAPDMEVFAPDMEVFAPDMEVLAPDMEVFAPDMGARGLEVGATCVRGAAELSADELCLMGECLIDPLWDEVESLDGARDDSPPTLGAGVCDDMPPAEPLDRVMGLACDVEEVRYRCGAQGVCFDPVEADALDDPRVMNGDGVCLSAHPILTLYEEREVSLSEGDVSLFRVVGDVGVTLIITPDERCDPQAPLSLTVARRAAGAWSMMSYASSDGASCPSIELDLTRNELMYISARHGAFTGLPRLPTLEEPLTFGLTFELRAPDRDRDGTPDDLDCAPDDPEIPAPDELPGNGVDDDCDPFTLDEESAEGAACDRANFGLGCVEPLFCLQGQEDGVGVCGEPPQEFIELELNDRCDVYEVENGCSFIDQLCFDAARYGFDGLDDPESPESRSLTDGDGVCVLFEPAFEDSGVTQVELSGGSMLAVSVFAAFPSSLTVELTPPMGDACPLDPELKLFSSAFNEFGFISVYEDGAGGESADATRCAQLTLPFVSDEVMILVSSADAAGEVNAQLSWSLTPIP